MILFLYSQKCENKSFFLQPFAFISLWLQLLSVYLSFPNGLMQLLTVSTPKI